MATIANLVVRVQADVADLRTNLESATKTIQRVETQTNSLSGAMGRLPGVLSSIAGAMGVAFSVNGLISATKATLEWADALADTATGLGITTEELQRLEYAWTMTGSSAEKGLAAMQMMLQRVGAGSADRAIEKLGLSIYRIEQMDSAQMFLTLTRSLAGVTSETERAALGAEIFGKGWKSIMISVANDMEKVAQQAPHLADEQIKALERTRKAWESFGIWWRVQMGQILAGPPAPPQPGKGSLGVSEATVAQLGGGAVDDVARLYTEIAAQMQKQYANALKALPSVVTPAFGATAAEMAALDSLTVKLSASADAATKHEAAVEAMFKSLSGAEEIEAFHVFNAALDDLTARHIAPSGEALEQYRKQAYDAVDALNRLGRAAEATAARGKAVNTLLPSTAQVQSLATLPSVMSSIEKPLVELAPLMVKTWLDTPRLAIPAWTELSGTLKGIGHNLESFGWTLMQMRGAAGEVGRALATVSQAFTEIGKLQAVQQKALAAGDEETFNAAKVGKWTAALSAASAVLGQFAQQNKIAAVASGALSGALAGLPYGPVGAGIGAIAGALSGGILGLLGSESTHRASQQMIDDWTQQEGGLTSLMAKLKQFGKSWSDIQLVIDHLGAFAFPMLTTQLEQFQARLDASSSAGKGWTTMVVGWATPMTEAITKLAGLKSQLASATSALDISSLTAQITYLSDSLKAVAPQGQATFTRLADEAETAFYAMLHSGASMTDTLAAMRDGLQTLIDLQDQYDYTVDAGSEKMLTFYRAVAANQDLVTYLGGLNDYIGGIFKSLQATPDLVNEFGADLLNTMQTLTSRGVSVPVALVMEQSPLQQLWEASQKPSVALGLDDATRALIQQAVDVGLVGADRMSVEDQTLGVLTDIRDLVADIADVTAYGGSMKEGPPPLTNGTGYERLPPQYAFGSSGFEYFGAGQMALLHDWEAIIPRNQVLAGHGAALDAVLASLPAGLMGDSGSQPSVLPSGVTTPVSGGAQRIQILLDGREIARASARYIPGELVQVGV